MNRKIADSATVRTPSRNKNFEALFCDCQPTILMVVAGGL